MICSVCVDALQHRKGWTKSDPGRGKLPPNAMITHHESIASLKSSADACCEICRPFWMQLSEEEQSKLCSWDATRIASPNYVRMGARTAGQRLDEFEGYVTKIVVMNLMQHSNISPLGINLVVSIDFESAIIDAAPLKRVIVGVYALHKAEGDKSLRMTPFLSDTTASEDSWAKASKWLQECVKTHSLCNTELKNEPFYPTRLLDITTPGAGFDMVHLIMTSDTQPSRGERYMTLSHCWGKAEFFQLKRNTFDKLRKGVHLEDLPRSFRDAIQITRKLGVRYLWIDSLCIFQDKDDLTDWLAEAEKMHKVYSYSFYNISASGAKDSSQGLFFTRDPRMSLNEDLIVDARNLNLDSDFVTYHLLNIGFWDHTVGQSPINQRGWVLQERLLSPRVIHFSRDQLFWECREHCAAECYPQGLPEMLHINSTSRFKTFRPPILPTNGIQQDNDGDDTLRYYQIWNTFIETYSKTRLTKPGDKMIALSGIAKKFAALTGDRYVAGMWHKYLISALVWRVSNQIQMDGSPSARPEPYRAPSFSWASVDGRVEVEAPINEKLLAEVVDIQLDYVSADQTGLIRGGYLELKGHICPFEMVVDMTYRYQKLYLRVGGVIVKDSAASEWGFGPLVHLDVSQASFDNENRSGSLYYVPMREQQSPDDYVCYLLLLLVDPEKSWFRRVGTAVTNSKEEIDMLNDFKHRAEGKKPYTSYSESPHAIRII